MTGAGLHVAIIMDGNGRWARARGLPRIEGHRRGARAVRRVVEAAPELGIDTLTLYAFSSDNWARPASEVRALMELFERYLREESPRCVEHGIRISVIGRRDRLGAPIVDAIARAEAVTAAERRLHLRLAVDYSAREAIARAAGLVRGAADATPERFGALVCEAIHSPPGIADVDLLLRTSGEQRLSDFLLWECAYAELVFVPKSWPEFGRRDLERALGEFGRRERRYGRVLEGAV